ncbi:hypothetical protein [Klebsiella phage MY01]|nr:hypothetical protein [Pseudomonas phage MY01]
MNKELLVIFSELRDWGLVRETMACKGNVLNIADWDRCQFHCTSCLFLQLQAKKYYPDMIIQISSQLNK